MRDRLRVGTRGSPLAVAQTEIVLQALRRRFPALRFETERLSTSGDRTQRSTGTLDFTDAIDRELEAGRVDIAVHSAKDLPARPERSVMVAAYPRREDPRDCVVLRRGRSLATLSPGARLGSSSLRRRAQLLRWRRDLLIVPVRGNVGTRIGKIESEQLDGVVLAAAGLRRLGWADRISEYLPLGRFLPAPGQGTLAVEVRKGDTALRRIVASIDDGPTRAAAVAERAVVEAIGGDCNVPLGALARTVEGRLQLRAVVLSPDGRRRFLASGTSSPASAYRLGRRVGRDLASAGILERDGSP